MATRRHPQVRIQRVTREGQDQFKGTITGREGNTVYEVVRWSESAVRSALIRFLYQAKASAPKDTQIVVEIDDRSSEKLEKGVAHVSK